MAGMRLGVPHAIKRLPLAALLLVALAVGVALLLLLPRGQLPVQTRALAGWNGTVITFLILICCRPHTLVPSSYDTPSKPLAYGKASVLAAVLVACMISVAATGITLNTVARYQPGARMHANLSLLSVLSSWFLVQALFALFYARNYYLPVPGGDGKPGQGLKFPMDDVPDFWDFVYFSFTVGITYATSDTDITSRMLRRAVLVQSIISFLFYTIIIGLLINAVLQML